MGSSGDFRADLSSFKWPTVVRGDFMINVLHQSRGLQQRPNDALIFRLFFVEKIAFYHFSLRCAIMTTRRLIGQINPASSVPWINLLRPHIPFR